MNLHEIEKALRTLNDQHSNLTEDTLLILLRAGGWEEKTIREALVLFRTLDFKVSTGVPAMFPQAEKGMAFPHIEDKVELPGLVKEDHRIEEKRAIATPAPHSVNISSATGEIDKVSKSTFEIERKTLEVEGPQEKIFSLIERDESVPVPQESKNMIVAAIDKTPTGSPSKPSLQMVSSSTSAFKKNELPENLPLKVYEHSPHAIPFSQYRDTVYGIIEEEQEGGAYEEGSSIIVPEVEINSTSTKVSAFEAETKLVILASVMLLTIMLLLGYMYTNGRL